MNVRFVGIDPATPGGNCPAVFLEDDTDAFVFQGWQVSPEDVPPALVEHGPLTDAEAVVRLPARMRDIITDAILWPRQPRPHDGYATGTAMVDDNGDVLFRGLEITDHVTRAKTSRHSPINDNETLVWLPSAASEALAEVMGVRADVR